MTEAVQPWQQAAVLHAMQAQPGEACGLLVIRHGREIYVPCRNVAPNASTQFALCPQDWAAAEADGEVAGVVHSHPLGGPEPSEADRVACEASGLPWHIVGLPTLRWVRIAPDGYRAPLIGRQWAHGVLDCYTLIRDWYREARGVVLPDFYRPEAWWSAGGNLYLAHYQEAGFRRVHVSDDLRPAELTEGDVLLMQVASPVPNHGAIWLADGTILHHFARRLSSRDVFGGYWRKHTTHVLRRDV